jgi:hypothetical protein
MNQQGVKIQPAKGGQFSTGVDMVEEREALDRWEDEGGTL